MANLKNTATLDTKPFNQGLKGMEGRVSSFGGKLKGAYKAAGAAVAVGAMVKLGHSTLKTADEIDNLSKQLGIGIESTQSLKVMFEEAGMSLSSMNTVVATAKKAQAEALTGNKLYADSFRKLGIEMNQLRGMNMEQVIEAVGRAMASGGDNAEVTASALDILGSRSVKLQGVLTALGDEGFSDLNKRMLETKQIMETDMVKAGDKMEEDLARSMNKMKVGAQSFFVKFAIGMKSLGRSKSGAADDLFGFETAVLVTPKQRADARAAELRAVENIARVNEETAQQGLSEIREKRRFWSLSKDAQNAELASQKQALNLELSKTTSAERRLELETQIFDLEKKIGKEKEQEKVAEDEPSGLSFGADRFKSVGGSGFAPGMKVTPHQQRQQSMQQKMLAVAKNQERLLEDILDTEKGASF